MATIQVRAIALAIIAQRTLRRGLIAANASAIARYTTAELKLLPLGKLLSLTSVRRGTIVRRALPTRSLIALLTRQPPTPVPRSTRASRCRFKKRRAAIAQAARRAASAHRPWLLGSTRTIMLSWLFGRLAGLAYLVVLGVRAVRPSDPVWWRTESVRDPVMLWPGQRGVCPACLD